MRITVLFLFCICEISLSGCQSKPPPIVDDPPSITKVDVPADCPALHNIPAIFGKNSLEIAALLGVENTKLNQFTAYPEPGMEMAAPRGPRGTDLRDQGRTLDLPDEGFRKKYDAEQVYHLEDGGRLTIDYRATEAQRKKRNAALLTADDPLSSGEPEVAFNAVRVVIEHHSVRPASSHEVILYSATREKASPQWRSVLKSTGFNISQTADSIRPGEMSWNTLPKYRIDLQSYRLTSDGHPTEHNLILDIHQK